MEWPQGINVENLKKLAAKNRVGKVTVGVWCHNKTEQFSTIGCSNISSYVKKTMKQSEYETMSEPFFIWFSQQGQKGTISGPIRKENMSCVLWIFHSSKYSQLQLARIVKGLLYIILSIKMIKNAIVYGFIMMNFC